MDDTASTVKIGGRRCSNATSDGTYRATLITSSIGFVETLRLHFREQYSAAECTVCRDDGAFNHAAD